jgi:hypothetical protein
MTEKNLKKSIEKMMFGFGDEWPPNEKTVEVVEFFVRGYIQNLVVRAQNVAVISGKLDRDCFLYLVRQDTLKFNRIDRLLKANEDIRVAKKVEITAQEDDTDITKDDGL